MKPNQITLFRISEFMAHTQRFEFKVKQWLDQPEKVGYQGRASRVAIVKQRGKHICVHLDLKADDILLDSWDVPFKADNECSGVWSGNACYNFVGEKEVVKDWIENRALYPVSDKAKGCIFVMAEPRTKCNDDGMELLYSDVRISHAVVQRFNESRCAATENK